GVGRTPAGLLVEKGCASGSSCPEEVPRPARSIVNPVGPHMGYVHAADNQPGRCVDLPLDFGALVHSAVRHGVDGHSTGGLTERVAWTHAPSADTQDARRKRCDMVPIDIAHKDGLVSTRDRCADQRGAYQPEDELDPQAATNHGFLGRWAYECEVD